MKIQQNRRSAIKNILAGTGAIAAAGTLSSFRSSAGEKPYELKGNINQSVCRWIYNKIPLDEFCATAKEIGIKGIDLVHPEDWPTLKKYGLYAPMCWGAEISIAKGFNDPQYHDQLVDRYTKMITQMADAGYNNLICFAGNRNGKDDETGMANCELGLKRILPIAEKNGITISMELLNSKIDHKDYQCDRLAWGTTLVKKIGSEKFKLLFDIYHQQINEGDIIRSIQANHQYISHYHTAGVPGRNEIDNTQELYYPAIMKAIKDTGYTGYVAHEFNAKNQDKIAALKDAVKICDI